MGLARFERGFCLFLSGLMTLPQAVTPATIRVEGGCTLPDAISAANLDAAVGGCSAGSGADTLRLTADVELSSVDNRGNGLPKVASTMTIAGDGFSITRAQDARPFRIIDVQESGDLTLKRVTVANGRSSRGAGLRTLGDLTLINSTVSGNSSTGRGGAIYSRGGDYQPVALTLRNTVVSGNSARRGAGIAAYDYSSVTISGSAVVENVAKARGGGILINNSSSTTITGSTVSYNSASTGGGIWGDFYSNLAIINTTVSGNTARRRDGGGIFSCYHLDLTLDRSRVVGNSARRGGGLFAGNGYGRITVKYSTISGNEARRTGGGANFVAGAGGITVSLSNTTISGNSAESGGGIYQRLDYYRHESSIRHSTISQNSATAGAGIYAVSSSACQHLLDGNIVADNQGGNCAGGGLAGEGSNFDDDGSCPGSTPIAPGADFDTELADNGGLTVTHALLEGSVATDSGGECFLPADQRGFIRDGNCDGGAFEFGAEPPEMPVSRASCGSFGGLPPALQADSCPKEP